MNEYLHAVVAQQTDGMMGLGDLFHDAVCGCYYLAAAGLNSAALAQHLTGEHRVLDPGQCADTS